MNTPTKPQTVIPTERALDIITVTTQTECGVLRARQMMLTPVTDTERPYRYLVAKNTHGQGMFVIASTPDNPNRDLTEDAYEAIVDEATRAGLDEGTYHVYSRLSLLVTDDVVWHHVPDHVMR